MSLHNGMNAIKIDGINFALLRGMRIFFLKTKYRYLLHKFEIVARPKFDATRIVLFTELFLRSVMQGGSNMTGTDFFVTIIAHHSSNSQTGLNRF